MAAYTHMHYTAARVSGCGIGPDKPLRVNPSGVCVCVCVCVCVYLLGFMIIVRELAPGALGGAEGGVARI